MISVRFCELLIVKSPHACNRKPVDVLKGLSLLLYALWAGK